MAVHFRVGVLKQQLGNHTGARDARHAIDVSKLLLGRFSLGQQMLRIVREDGTLIPVNEQLNLRSLSDNLNITGNLNVSGCNNASTAPAAPQLGASSIYSSNSSGLSSLMPKLRVPEPDVTDPTESLRELSQLSGERWTSDRRGKQPPALAVLDGTRDMWRGEFAPGVGRLQLPDVEIELTREESVGRSKFELFHSAPTASGPWLPPNPRASETLQGGRSYESMKVEAFGQNFAYSSFGMSVMDSARMPISSYAVEYSLPCSSAKSPNVREPAIQPHNSSRFVDCAATSSEDWTSRDAPTRGGGSSFAALASVVLADPDVVHVADTYYGNVPQLGQPDPLWSEHQASPMVDMLHQYLKQQHEVTFLRSFCVRFCISIHLHVLRAFKKRTLCETQLSPQWYQSIIRHQMGI